MTTPTPWSRLTLLIVLAYEALGGLAGGATLVARPDGSLMNMPVRLLHGAFASFRIPGGLLLGLGVLSLAAFVAAWRRSRLDWALASLAVGGWIVWFFVEIIVIREVHWLHGMWGLPVLVAAGPAAALWPLPQAPRRDLALAAGVLSSLLYVAMVVFVPRGWPGYDAASRVVSELSAVGAPTRPLWTALGALYTLSIAAFGWGVRAAARDNRRLRAAGALIVVYAAMGLVWPFAPMHLRETLAAGGGSASDTLHIALGAVTEIVYALALGFAAAALGKAFRVYSIATLVTLAAFGVLTFLAAPGIGANAPTPLVGVWERIDIGVFLLWVVVLAVTLLARDGVAHATSGRAPRPAAQGA
ncbi:MAG TPA: DUF998 domain-containing protein [Polyangia bacterium]|nr:DUF998 domain-containing protein [Polyangia bacterium]